jgi:hypothetical protein
MEMGEFSFIMAHDRGLAMCDHGWVCLNSSFVLTVCPSPKHCVVRSSFSTMVSVLYRYFPPHTFSFRLVTSCKRGYHVASDGPLDSIEVLT